MSLPSASSRPGLFNDLERESTGSAGRFVLGPFEFVSDIPLIELREASAEQRRVVSVRLGPVARQWPELKELYQGCFLARKRYMLEIDGIARYLVEDGAKVTVDVAAGAPEADVRGYLLGSVFGALCHQNGFLPLHASAVEAGGKVTAFLGDSGAGKSTMAAFLERAGYRVVSDDICLLIPDEGGFSVEPVAGWLKLWRESFDNLGEVPEEENRIFSANDKYRRYLAVSEGERLQLANVVLLERGDTVSLERVSNARAVAGMIDRTYLAYLPLFTDGNADLFRRVAGALEGARAWRLVMPKQWDAMPAVLDTVAKQLLRDEGSQPG